MSNGTNMRAHGLPYRNPSVSVYPQVARSGPMNTAQAPPTRTWSGVSVVSVEPSMGRRPTHSQRPGPTYHAVSHPPSAAPNRNHIQSLQQTRVQPPAGQGGPYPRLGGPPGGQIANDFRYHDARYSQPIHQATMGSQLRTGEYRAYPPPPPPVSTASAPIQQRSISAHHYATQPYGQTHPIIPLADTYNYQSNMPAAAPLRVSTHGNPFCSSPTAISPPSPDSLGSGDTSPTTSSPPPNAAFATELCPFPKCGRRCGRRQELERHIRQHLPNCIGCTQPNCAWTGNRRYALGNHFKKAHPGIPFLPHEGITIYDAKGLVKQILNKEISVERAEGEARSSFQSRAEELGKLGIWRE